MKTLPFWFVPNDAYGSVRLTIAIGDFFDNPSTLHIIGTCQMVNDEPVPESFRPSSEFSDFLYSTIAKAGPVLPGLKEYAREIHSGEVAIIDLRSPNDELVLRDVFGTFRVMDGCIQADSFSRNQAHALFTEDGLFVLPEEMYSELLEQLAPKLRSDA